MSLPGNTFAYRLLTPRALDFESDNMGHCVGRGYYDVDVINDKTRIYSIRDERGEPHVTFEVKEPEDSVFVVEQCNGKQNKAPVQKYMDAVQTLIEKMGWEIGGDLKNIGLIKIAEKYYNLQALIDGKVQIPENTVFNGNLNLNELELIKLPDLSNLIVNGGFYCSSNQLTSLEGAPKQVGGNFRCYNNQLTSLEGAPKEVGGDFDCHNNQLRSLEGAPKEVGTSFFCSNNQLTSLEGAPKKVFGEFDCSGNQLTSLEGAPKEVGGFDCSRNQLTSLEGAPKEIGVEFDCSYNNLSSLEGAPEKVYGDFNCFWNQLTSLEGAPKEVGGDFNCSNNRLTSLDGRPKASKYFFDNNPLQRCGNERE